MAAINAGEYDFPRFSDTAPVYSGGARLMTWSSSPKRGMTVVLHLKDVDQYGVHPFKGMVCGPIGQRLRTAVVFPSVDDAAQVGLAVYEGEAALFSWADENLNGMVVRLLLDSGPDGARGRHPFDGLRVGRKEGEDLLFTAWALAENSEQPVDPKMVRRRRPFSECPATQQAQILCHDTRRFVPWLAGRVQSFVPDEAARRRLPDPRPSPREFAADVVRSWCGIASRAVLNHDTPEGERARIRWRTMLSSYDDAVWGRTISMSDR